MYQILLQYTPKPRSTQKHYKITPHLLNTFTQVVGTHPFITLLSLYFRMKESNEFMEINVFEELPNNIQEIWIYKLIKLAVRVAVDSHHK
jgi:hypothetical protein